MSILKPVKLLVKNPSSLSNWITGRSYLYLLNAYTDAYLAQSLVDYCRHQDLERIKNSRVKSLVTAVDGDLEKVLGVAFCQYYFNGWYDYICGRLIEKLVEKDSNLGEYKKELKVTEAFSEVNLGFFNLVYSLIWPLVFLLIGRLPNSGKFIDRFKIKKAKINKKALIRACCLTQKENIKNNVQQIRNLKKNTTRKVFYINQQAEQFENEDEFIRVVKGTLKMASWWDKIFCSFLKIRFPFLLG